MNGLREQRKAVETVREFGGEASFHLEVGEGYDVRRVDLSNTDVSDLTPFSRCKNLEKLLLNKTNVKDLTPLKELTNLETLWLEDTQVSDVTPLADMEQLQWLILRGTEVNDLAPLAGLENLENLWLDYTPVNDLTPLHNLNSLRQLELHETPTTKGQVDNLQAALPRCKITWSSSDPDIGAADWLLRLGGSIEVSSGGQSQTLPPYSDLPSGAFRITAIDLTKNRIFSDKSLAHLKPRKPAGLTRLNVTGTQVSAEAVTDFKEAYPECDVTGP